MSRFVRLISLVLLVLFVSASILGCSTGKDSGQSQTGTASGQSQTTAQTGREESAYFNETGMPIVNEPITLKIFSGRHRSQVEFDQMLMWQEYEKISGIKVIWTTEVSATLEEKRNLMLAGGDLPDVFFKSQMPISDLINYGSQGVFTDLSGLIDQYAPNIKAAFEKYPEVGKGIKMPDGKIYSLPYIDDNPGTRITAKMYINKTWLDVLNLNMPSTTDEFYNVLKAFRNGDPNGNDIKDEIPYSSPYKSESIPIMLAGSFGLMNRGNASRDFDIDEKTGKLRFIPIQPEYKQMLEYIRKLYAEELLDKDIFTITSAQFTAKVDEGTIGCTQGPSEANLGTKRLGDYVGIPTVLKGPEGHQLLGVAGAQIRNFGSFVMTKENKYPEATIRWVDYFYSEEGIKLLFMGIEGVTYNMDSNGNAVWVDEIMKDANGLTPEHASGRYLPWNGGDNPSIVTVKFFPQFTPVTMEAINGVKDYMPKEVWPAFVFTEEENNKLIALRNDINTYVNEMRDKFIAGTASFDTWDQYVEKLKQMGLDEYEKIYQAAYDRYKQQ